MITSCPASARPSVMARPTRTAPPVTRATLDRGVAPSEEEEREEPGPPLGVAADDAARRCTQPDERLTPNWENQPMIDLSGRSALVTGGSEGIGRSIVQHLAAAGANVVLTSRSAERAEEAARALDEESAGQVVGVACDVRDPAACDATVAGVVDRFGGLDILVNNAGLGVFKSIAEMSVEEWEVQIRTNLDGVFYTSRAAVPHLVAADDAWIVNIGSLASRNTFAGGVGYNASKFGLLGMTEAMMLDLRHEGVRVSIVMPGSVNTNFGLGNDRDWAIQPDDIGKAVLDLLAQPGRTLISRIEVRPSAPPKR